MYNFSGLVKIDAWTAAITRQKIFHMLQRIVVSNVEIISPSSKMCIEFIIKHSMLLQYK